MLAVGRYIDVVLATVHRNGQGPCQRTRVDEIQRTGLPSDCDDNPLAVLGHRDIVRMAAEGHLLDHLAALSLYDVKGAVGFIADIDARPVGGEVDPMGRFNALDLLHDLVGCRVDDVNAISGAVRDIDTPPIRSTC